MSRLQQRVERLSPRQRALLEQRLAALRSGRERPAERAPEAEAYPLTLAQRRLWFIDRMEADSSFYNIARAVRLEGPLAVGALARAITEVVRRHQALRTRFSERGGEPVQTVTAPQPVPLPLVDLGGLDADARRRQVERRSRQAASRPFDLASGRLLRCLLLRLGTAEHAVVCAVHHIAADHWSVRLLLRELTALYGAFAAGRSSPLPEPAAQYKDFALWQQRALEAGELERQLAYWRHRLSGAPAFLELPIDRPRPAVQRFCGTQRDFTLPRRLVADLGRWSREQGATLFMTLLAAWQVVLHHHSRQEDIVVSAPVGARPHREWEGLIGFFTETVLLRTDLSGNPSFRELLAGVRQTVLEALAHPYLPLEQVVEQVAPARVSSYSPLLQASINVIEDDTLTGRAAAAAGEVTVEDLLFDHDFVFNTSNYFF